MHEWIIHRDRWDGRPRWYVCPICKYTYDNFIDHVSETGYCPNCKVPMRCGDGDASTRSNPEKEATDYNPVYEAYKILVDVRDNGKELNIDEVIGYLGEAL